jgi:hypothetical protein
MKEKRSNAEVSLSMERSVMSSVTTIGNATMVVRDGSIILVTAPQPSARIIRW